LDSGPTQRGVPPEEPSGRVRGSAPNSLRRLNVRPAAPCQTKPRAGAGSSITRAPCRKVMGVAGQRSQAARQAAAAPKALGIFNAAHCLASNASQTRTLTSTSATLRISSMPFSMRSSARWLVATALSCAGSELFLSKFGRGEGAVIHELAASCLCGRK